MVRSRYLFLLIVLILGAAAGFWLFVFHQTEEEIIRRRLQDFAGEACRQEREGGLKAAVTAGHLGGYFADPAVIDVDGLGWLNGECSPEMITSNAIRARKMFKVLILHFRDMEVTVRDGRAEAFFTAVLEGSLQSGDSVREVRELELHLVRPEKKWLFQKVNARKVLRR